MAKSDKGPSLEASNFPKGEYSFFSPEGGRNLGRVQVICNMPFLMLREEHEMANPSAPEIEATFYWS